MNELLTSIGQKPVSSLSVTGIGDVNLAKTFLRRQTRAVQMHGFAFNTDTGYELSPDVNGIIKVPQGVLRIDPGTNTEDYRRRFHPDGYWALWNADDLTWTFTEPVDCKITWGFPFEHMPDTARLYVTISAGRKFQNQIIGATSLDGYSAEDENKAWITLQRDERQTRDTNLFRRNASLARIDANRSY